VVWAAVLSPGVISAQTDDSLRDRSLHITSDAMIAEKDNAFVAFTGNAVATSRDTVIHADTIKVFLYTEEEKKQLNKTDEQNIKEIVATGNMTFTSQDQKAYADKAVYTTATQILILTGDAPRVTTGKNYVTGKKITLFRSNGRVVVESGKDQRVEAMFNAADTKKNKEGE
jgi:lipopolysaccharide export system protein LptA